MAKPKKLRPNLGNNQSGFVIIIALGMILLLSIFAIIIQQTTINTLRSMKDSENIWHAQNWAGSVMEHLQSIVNKSGGAGINSGRVVCAYGDYVATDSSGATVSGNTDVAEGGGQS